MKTPEAPKSANTTNNAETIHVLTHNRRQQFEQSDTNKDINEIVNHIYKLKKITNTAEKMKQSTKEDLRQRKRK